MEIRVLGFKHTIAASGKVDEWVQFTSRDALYENGQVSHSTWEKVSRMVPPDHIQNDEGGLKIAAMRSQWAQIEPAYLAWREGNELPENGTPLAAWPGLNEDQMKAIKAVGFKTVEDFANAPETVLARPVVPNMRALVAQAKTWLEGRGGAEMAAELQRLREQNEALIEMMAEQKAEAADKPRRGRPPKAEAEQAA